MKQVGCSILVCLGIIAAIICCILLVSVMSASDIPPFDKGLERLMLIDPPDVLIYEAGENNKLNTNGGLVRLRRDTPGYKNCEVNLSFFTKKYIKESIQFKREGVYIITVAKTHLLSQDLYCQYTIQVVQSGEYLIAPASSIEENYLTLTENFDCENVTAVMTAPPDNIIYPVGYDGEINPSGIVLKLVGDEDEKEYDIADLDYTLESDVDFNTPGSYIVKVYYTDNSGAERWFCFTVAVAEKAEK